MSLNSYNKWHIEQDTKLFDLYYNNIEIKDIAIILGRSSSAIKARLEHLCFNYYKNDIKHIKNELINLYYINKK